MTPGETLTVTLTDVQVALIWSLLDLGWSLAADHSIPEEAARVLVTQNSLRTELGLPLLDEGHLAGVRSRRGMSRQRVTPDGLSVLPPEGED